MGKQQLDRSIETISSNISRTPSPVVRLWHLCPEDVSRPTKLYASKLLFFFFFFQFQQFNSTTLGMMVHYHDPECHEKRLCSYLQGQCHDAELKSSKHNVFFHISWTSKPIATTFWYSSASSRAGVLCGNVVLLSTRSRSQLRFNNPQGNNCPDNIFRTT